MASEGLWIKGSLSPGEISAGVNLVAWVDSSSAAISRRGQIGRLELISVGGAIPFGFKLGANAGPALFSGATIDHV